MHNADGLKSRRCGRIGTSGSGITGDLLAYFANQIAMVLLAAPSWGNLLQEAPANFGPGAVRLVMRRVPDVKLLGFKLVAAGQRRPQTGQLGRKILVTLQHL